jgi:hypothetical protein
LRGVFALAVAVFAGVVEVVDGEGNGIVKLRGKLFRQRGFPGGATSVDGDQSGSACDALG